MGRNIWLLLFICISALGQERIQQRKAGTWVGPRMLQDLPTDGKAWAEVRALASADGDQVNLGNPDLEEHLITLARAYVYVREGNPWFRERVIESCMAAIDTEHNGTTLALARNLPAYVIAAELVGLPEDKDMIFKEWLSRIGDTKVEGGSLKDVHRRRPNNWGTLAGAARAVIAVHLGRDWELVEIARIFKGWLGDREAYAGFAYGDLSWQADPENPVGINPKGAKKNGHCIDGVLPDDQRRGGSFSWPPPKENYVYTALQGAVVQAIVLSRAGYPVWDWEDQALLRAFQWLHHEADFPAVGDDTWLPHLVNFHYGRNFPAPIEDNLGKNFGFSAWTHTKVGSQIWVDRGRLATLSSEHPSWDNLIGIAEMNPGKPNLSQQNQDHDVHIFSKALVYAKTGNDTLRQEVIDNIMAAIGTEKRATTLVLARNLPGYIVSADLVGLPEEKDRRFRDWLRKLPNFEAKGGSLVFVHRTRPNNWGTHAGAARAAIAAYLEDKDMLADIALTFKTWLGDDTGYDSFVFGNLAWQANPEKPVGINPKGTTKGGYLVDGVLADVQRLSGDFVWPPPRVNSVYSALQGAVVQAVILYRCGYDVWDWGDQALLRAFSWLNRDAVFPVTGDDTWLTHVINYYYDSDFPAPVPSQPGKNLGWTDWTHRK